MNKCDAKKITKSKHGLNQKIDVIHNKLSAWKKEPEEQEPIRSSYLTSLYAVTVDQYLF
jgi:hypothetical protein